MTNRADWKLGMSTCFYGKCDEQTFAEFRAAGVECVELSQKRMDYYDRYDFVQNPLAIRRMAENQGLSIWSIHLPFSRVEDISMDHDALRAATMETNRVLIRCAAEAGISVAVIHPSSEPIDPRDRQRRMSRCVEGLAELAELASSVGVQLAVENLPRTCLGHSAEEIFALCCAIRGLMVTFDTNHLIGQYADNPGFVRMIGSRIATLHVSDYDFIDERHTLPGDGLNDWPTILSGLERAGYSGPWMYEVPSRGVLTAADVAANHQEFVMETASARPVYEPILTQTPTVFVTETAPQEKIVADTVDTEAPAAEDAPDETPDEVEPAAETIAVAEEEPTEQAEQSEPSDEEPSGIGAVDAPSAADVSEESDAVTDASDEMPNETPEISSEESCAKETDAEADSNSFVVEAVPDSDAVIAEPSEPTGAFSDSGENCFECSICCEAGDAFSEPVCFDAPPVPFSPYASTENI